MTSPVLLSSLQLPASGRWAIGSDARQKGEQLLALARAQGLRTAWLGAEAGFLSNLSVLENLRLIHDWHDSHDQEFGPDLQGALDTMALAAADWLPLRPSQLPDSQLILARFLRVLLLRPDALVLSPLALEQAGDILSTHLLERFDKARIFLLDQSRANWPAWPPHDILAASSTESPV